MTLNEAEKILRNTHNQILDAVICILENTEPSGDHAFNGEESWWQESGTQTIDALKERFAQFKTNTPRPLITNEILNPKRFVLSEFEDAGRQRYDTDLETTDDETYAFKRLKELINQGRQVRMYDFQKKEYRYA